MICKSCSCYSCKGSAQLPAAHLLFARPLAAPLAPPPSAAAAAAAPRALPLGAWVHALLLAVLKVAPLAVELLSPRIDVRLRGFRGPKAEELAGGQAGAGARGSAAASPCCPV